MEEKSRSGRKSGSTHSRGAGDKDLIAELKNRIAVLENELRLKQEDATSPGIAKRAEEALRESEARFRSLLDNSIDCIYCLNVQTGRYEYISPSCETLVGYTAEELMAQDLKTALLMIFSEDLPALLAAGASCNETGKAKVEYRQWTKSGELRWISNHMSLVRDSNGRPLYRNGNLRDITDRKRADEALRESEGRFHAVQESNPDGFLMLQSVRDNAGRIIDFTWTYMNGPAERVIGVSPGGLIGKRLLEVHPGTRDEGLFDAYVRVVETGEPYRREVLYTRDGLDRYVRLMAIKVGDGFAVTFFDISDRRRMEDALRKSETKLRAVFGALAEGVVFLNTRGEVEDVNDAVQRIHGQTLQELSNPELDPRWKIIRPDGTLFPVGEQPAIVAIRTGKAVHDVEMGVPTTNGLRWRLVSAQPVHDEHGELLGAVASFFDITERKRAEEALAAAYRQFQSIIDNTPDIVYAFNLEERFVMANTAVAELLNSTPEQMIGKRRHEFMPKDDADWHEANDRQAIEAGRALEFEEYSQLKDRSITWLTKKFPLRDAQGRIYAVAGISADITPRKRAEEALKASEERSNLAFKAAQEGVWDWNMETDEVWYSPRYKEMLGYSGEEVEHHVSAWLRLLHPDDKERALELVDAFIRGEREYRVEFRMRHKDGHYLDILSRGFPVRRESDGKVVRIVGTHFDLTERKRAEERLHRQAELINLSPDATIVRRMDGTITFWSRGAESLYGWTRQEAIGQQSHAILCTRFSIPLEEVIRQLRETGHWTGELIHRSKDGLDIIVQSRWLMQTHDVDEILESNVDITERKRVEEELRRSRDELDERVRKRTSELQKINEELEARIQERNKAEEAVRLAYTYNRSLIEASLDPLVTISPNGVITDVNKATETVTGYPREYLIGTDFSDYFTDPDKSREGYMLVFKKGSVTDYPLEIRHRDGYITSVVYNASVYRDEAGRVAGVFAAARDVTELKKAEDELRRAHDKLEERVRERTAELRRSNIELSAQIEERKRAEEALKEAKMQAELYLDLMGHDISNMHQIMEGQLELAQEIMAEQGKLEEDEKELIDTPLQTLERSNKLIENVRKLQKLRAGEYKTETIDLGMLLNEVVEEHSSIPSKDIVIDFSPVNNYLVAANPLLKDVFANLFGNAIKHSNGSLKIGVKMDRVNENGSPFYRVAIEDNGPGIPDEKKGELFHRFRRGQTQARGTGLGLYIVKTLVEGFHGRVEVEDRVPGDYTKGARFIVLLPALEGSNGI